PELPVSDNLTMNMKLLSSAGAYTANVTNVNVTVKTAEEKEDENKEEEKEVIVNQIPTDDANPFNLAGAEVSGTGTVKSDVENGNLDSFKNGATATFNVNCTQTGSYDVAFAAGSKNGATLHFAFYPEGSETAELEKDVTVEAQGGWDWVDVSSPLGNLSAGTKTLVITFIAAEGQTWTSNVKDLKFTIGTGTGINGITVKENASSVFTLDGKTVSPSKAQRGLYIIDGKKVIR
ncbi:MAG: carbohydrate-binding protein, partial [Prevotella sp.]